SNAALFASQPLTLEMLLRLFKRQGGLPRGQKELFSQAVTLLASEREERRDLGTVPDVGPDDLLEAAERLACFMVFSGLETVDLSDDPTAASLGRLELARLPSPGPRLTDQLLKAIGSSGLCEGDGVNRFRFIHRQIAEYLAGRRIATLLLHQSRALLSSGLGWHAGVAGPLRETAAFAAIESRDLARWVSETHPGVVGLCDVADDHLRRSATLTFLERFRRRELTDTLLVRDEVPLAGLEYTGAAHDLRPVLRERGEGCEDVLELAIELVKRWQLS